MRLPMLATSSRTQTEQTGGTINVAHRGASARMAENTLAAIRRAVACGADLIELDVQRSRDGALVLMHDTTLVRTTNARRVFPGRGPWRVSDFTHDELMRLDVGAWKSKDFAGERIPTLSEAIDVLRPTRAGLLLEVKAPHLYPGIVSDVVATMREKPGYVDSAVADRRVLVQSFDFAAMKDHKTRAPEIPVGLLGTPARANLPALATWADQVNPSHYNAERTYVDRVHELGMECFVWTVNRESAMKRAVRMGVDGIITNRPEVLGRLLSRRLSVP